MYYGGDTSKRMGPAAFIITGAAMVIVAVAVIYKVVIALKTGETMNLSRYHQELVSRQLHPYRFWALEAFWFIVSSALALLGVWGVISGFRRIGSSDRYDDNDA